MALIPAGSYVIGSNTGHPMTRPQHTVTLAAFGLDKHEVTVGEYKRFMDSTRSPAPWTGAMPRPSLPVTRVLWSEAARYCAARHADGGRLPSEEEWEAAARGAQGRLYPWGDRPEAARANTASARRKGIEPVGSFPQGASPEGVEDLIGNAWEWTSSPMKAYPRGDSTFDALQGYMVIRGGAFNTQDSVANAMRRGYNLPATNPDQLELTGFRCAMPARARNGGR
jgi:formylglycine-generating enzyme required for sulfatase activity